ncbi:MAG: IclR family transcriptional regulator [Pseudomonadota bacterium]
MAPRKTTDDAQTRPSTDKDGPRYRAPALAKGLEILELLAGTTEALTLSAISECLGRSRNEIFRMVQELEDKGYISKSLENEGYEITNRLFRLGMEQPRVVSVTEAALPIMRKYAETTLQSCHLAIPSGGDIVVVARMEAPGPVSFSVRVSHRQSIFLSTSGRLLFAFQTDEVRADWLKFFPRSRTKADKAAFLVDADTIRKRGHLTSESSFIRGVTDLAAPIIRGGSAVASLTSPCIVRIDDERVTTLPTDEIVAAASAISEKLLPTD